MRNKLKILPLIVIGITFFCCIVASGKDYEQASKERKIDYLYLEATSQNALENLGTANALYRRILEIDSNDVYAGVQLGNYIIQTATSKESFENGLEKLRKYYAVHPEDKSTSMYLGNIFLRNGLTNDAIDVWSYLDSIYPNDKDIKYYYATTLISTLDTVSVKKAFEIFESLEPEYGKVWLSVNKIRAYMSMNDTTYALAETRKLSQYPEIDANTLVTVANIYRAMEYNDSALATYQRACQADSTNGLAYYSLASFYLAQGDSISFDRETFNALSTQNLDVEIKEELLRNYIASIYDNLEYQDKILRMFDKLIELHPHEANIHFLYSQYLAYIEEYIRAAEQISYAIDMEPGNEQWTYQLISFYLSARELDKSLEVTESALKNFPDNTSIAYLAVIVYLQLDKYDEALKIGTEAVEKNVNSPTSDPKITSSLYTSIADIYMQLNDMDSLSKYYEQALTYNPENLLALNNYAYAIACNDGDLEKAEKMSAITVQKEPQNPTSLDTYAWIFFKKKEYNLAKEYIDKAIMLETEESAEIFHHAGDIYFMFGEPEEAVSFWKRALELDSENELLKKKVKHETYFYK